MEKEYHMNKECKITITQDNGRVVIDTKAPFIPTEVAQTILDESIKMVMHMKEPEEEHRFKMFLIHERKRWMTIAFLEVGFILFLILKLKGVI